MNLINEIDSYIYGFMLADGNLYETTRNRGRMTLELKREDDKILAKFWSYLQQYSPKVAVRERSTNFKEHYKTAILRIHSLEFRKNLKRFGYPTLNKSQTAIAPIVEYNEIGFWRGYIDGDGSIGISSKQVPFVSLCITSEILKDQYLLFLEKVTGEGKKLNRNKRDGVYNICSYRGKAKRLLSFLKYDQDIISLDRKKNNAIEILKMVEW